MLEIDVDVGWLATVLGNKRANSSLVFSGFTEVMPRQNTRRCSPPSRGPGRGFLVPGARIVHDIVHGEEIAGVIELGDELELVVQPLRDVFGMPSGYLSLG